MKNLNILETFVESNSDVGMPLLSLQRKTLEDLTEAFLDGSIKTIVREKCLCGSIERKLLNRRDRFGLPFGTALCERCGLIYQTRMLSVDSLALFYQQYYWPLINGDRDHSTTLSRNLLMLKSAFDKFLTSSKSTLVVLEIGCGRGELLAQVRELGSVISDEVGLQLKGFDYSSDAVDKAREVGLDVDVGGLEDALDSGVKADLLILSHVIEHVPDVETFLTQARQLMAEDGLVYVEVPGVLALKEQRAYGQSYQAFCVLAHCYNFCLSSLKSVMVGAGYQMVSGNENVESIWRLNNCQSTEPIKASDTHILNYLLECQQLRETKEKSIVYLIKQFIKHVIRYRNGA